MVGIQSLFKCTLSSWIGKEGPQTSESRTNSWEGHSSLATEAVTGSRQLPMNIEDGKGIRQERDRLGEPKARKNFPPVLFGEIILIKCYCLKLFYLQATYFVYSKVFVLEYTLHFDCVEILCLYGVGCVRQLDQEVEFAVIKI